MTGVNTANGAKVKADGQGVARAVFCFILCFSVKQCFVNENHARLVSQKHTRVVCQVWVERLQGSDDSHLTVRWVKEASWGILQPHPESFSQG